MNDLDKPMTPIERVRCALAMSDAGYKFDPLSEDVAALLSAYDEQRTAQYEFDPYGEAEQAGMKHALQVFGTQIAGIEQWEGGDGSETVDGDLCAEFNHIATAAGWLNAEGDVCFGTVPAEDQLTADDALICPL